MSFAAQPLPKAYSWLAPLASGLPLIDKALLWFGLHEAPGGADNPIIINWALELGVAHYNEDEMPWCGLFMAKVSVSAGFDRPAAPLWAKSWAAFGRPVETVPMLGDVLVFNRPNGGGHVGIYVGEDANSFHVLGGNEGNAVAIVPIARKRLFKARMPAYDLIPTQRRVAKLASAGTLSTNEG